jgi:hypothetical protein
MASDGTSRGQPANPQHPLPASNPLNRRRIKGAAAAMRDERYQWGAAERGCFEITMTRIPRATHSPLLYKTLPIWHRSDQQAFSPFDDGEVGQSKHYPLFTFGLFQSPNHPYLGRRSARAGCCFSKAVDIAAKNPIDKPSTSQYHPNFTCMTTTHQYVGIRILFLRLTLFVRYAPRHTIHAARPEMFPQPPPPCNSAFQLPM